MDQPAGHESPQGSGPRAAHAAISAYLAGGTTPAGSEAVPAEVRKTKPVAALPVDVYGLPANLRSKLSEFEAGPRKDEGTMDRSEHFYHLVGERRRYGLTQEQTTTALIPWRAAFGKYDGRVAEEVAGRGPR